MDRGQVRQARRGKNTPFGETVVSLREAENARDHC